MAASLLDNLEPTITPTEPMLAAPESQLCVEDWTAWAIERKYDGHRMIIYRIGKSELHVFARPTGDGRMIERTSKLPAELIQELKKLPPSVTDGELLGGDTGTDVTRKDLAHNLSMVIFDLLEVDGIDWKNEQYDFRRQGLVEIFNRLKLNPSRVQLAESHLLRSEGDALKFVQRVFKENGEGAILKFRRGRYLPGKRKKELWVKIKRKESAALPIVGFEPSRGEVRFPGHPFAIVRLMDDDGNETTCKTKTDEELAKFVALWQKKFPTVPLNQVTVEMAKKHPAVGRLLRIEFPRRTRTGGYQGPVIWDRWEDE